MKQTCKHCGIHFEPAHEHDDFCCSGCEYVYEIIHEQGLSKYYDLKQGTSMPVKSTPYQVRDYSWLAPLIQAAEETEKPELKLELQGITCVGCIWLVEKVFKQQEGARAIRIHPQYGTLQMSWDTGKFDAVAFAKSIQNFGYLVGPPGTDAPKASNPLNLKIGLTAAFALNAMLFTLPAYLGMGADFVLANLFELLTAFFATLSILVGGSYFFRRAWAGLQNRMLSIDLPISLGLIVAYISSWGGALLSYDTLVYFDFVAIFVFLMLVGRWVQDYALSQNRNQLIASSPLHKVEKEVEGGLKQCATETIRSGDKLSIRSGATIPVTARLLDNDATLSLEWINGESEPRNYRENADLPSGAVNLGLEPLRVEARETWSESLLAKLTTTQTENSHNPLMERVLSIYIASVIGIAALGFLGWSLMTGDLRLALQVAISILVVSCPCALGVAYPLINEIALKHLHKFGLFIRRDTLWARLRGIYKIVFDKTGTLTLEAPKLENQSVLNSLNDDDRIALGQLIRDSYHPVCRSLRENFRFSQYSAKGPLEAASIQEEAGFGLWAETEGRQWSLGRVGWQPSQPWTEESQETGFDCEFRMDARPVAQFKFIDSVKADAREAIQALLKRKLPVFILSGDRQSKVDTLAKQLGLSPEFAQGGMTPEAKAEWIHNNDAKSCLMIGDGANDSLAFESAGCSGTPVVDKGLLENKADFYFMGSGLSALLELFKTVSRRETTLRLVFAFAVIYNLAAIGVCLAGLMNPLVAAIIMPISSLATVGIAMTRR